MGRFINTDAYASTGQGLLGNNMFTYCVNNPINYVDSSGLMPLPAPGLVDYYFIHRQVQYEIAEERGYAMEVGVYSPSLNKWGRLDLYDGENNEYYEVKSILQTSTGATVQQMQKYDSSQIIDWRFLDYEIEESPARGTDASIEGQFEYKYWDIYYRFYSNGLIIYTYVINQQRYQQHLTMATVALTVGMMGFASGSGNKKPERVCLEFN